MEPQTINELDQATENTSKEQQQILLKRELIAQNTTEVTFKSSSSFSFLAGQYVTITLPQLNNLPTKEQFRDFSIASAPEDEGQISIAFRNSDSSFKQQLIHGEMGMPIVIDGPKGIFTLPEDTAIPVIFLAGGIGITPFRSMLRHIRFANLPIKPTLFYYNQNRESAAYLSEIEKYPESLDLVLSVDNAGIQEKEIESYIISHKDNTQWYLSGPREMVNSGRRILTKLGINERLIKSEEFSGYAK